MKANHLLDVIIQSNLPLSRLSKFYPEVITALQEYGCATVSKSARSAGRAVGKSR